ncbi:hypothetical protein GALL_537800 [mine drainage metagenome]|uniref:Uncharacterized protein n=1 Tax=mine drainage metagenome TaxID=410659 RepID=A0A1J5PB22_9ZZZZ
MMLQRLDLPLRQDRVEVQRHARRPHHLVHRVIKRHWQPHAAMFDPGGNRNPAAVLNGLEPLGKSRRSAHDSVFQPRPLLVAVTLQGREHGLAKLACLGQNRVNQIRRGVGEKVGGGNLRQVHDMVKDETEIGNGGAVRHVSSGMRSLALAVRARM